MSIIKIFGTLQSVNSTATRYIDNLKKGDVTSSKILPALTAHYMMHGNGNLLNKLLDAVKTINPSQFRFMREALLQCKALSKTSVINADGEQQYVKRIEGNMSEEEAIKTANLVPDWRVLQQADKAEKAANREARKLEKAAQAAIEKTENSDSNVDNQHLPSVVGVAHVRTDIAMLASKINDLLNTNKVSQNDQSLAASFIAWFQANDNLVIETEKATGTHGK